MPSTLSKLPHVRTHLSQPDGSTLVTSQTHILNLHDLPGIAKKAHTLPSIVNNLLAMCELSDAGCTILFTQHGCEVEYNGEIILQGWQDNTNNLCHVPLHTEKKTISSWHKPSCLPKYHPPLQITSSSKIYVIALPLDNSSDFTMDASTSCPNPSGSSHQSRILLRVAQPDNCCHNQTHKSHT